MIVGTKMNPEIKMNKQFVKKFSLIFTQEMKRNLDICSQQLSYLSCDFRRVESRKL